MVRSIAFGLLLALATTGFGTFSSPARAADPADEQARPARRAERHLWWNDPSVVEKLSLSEDQRVQMDGLFEPQQSAGKGLASQRDGRRAFHQALKQGDVDGARTKLASWAEEQGAAIQAMGEFKIGVLSLLSGEQSKALASAYPRLIEQPWTPRASWVGRPQQKRPAQKQPKPAR